ncbi:MAG: hypothetical protein ACO1N3_03765 [Gammaproteobacteria bacterium]
MMSSDSGVFVLEVNAEAINLSQMVTPLPYYPPAILYAAYGG